MYIIIIIVIILILVIFCKKDEKTNNIKHIKTIEQVNRENEIIDIIKSAILTKSKLIIEYISSYYYSGEEHTERIIIPLSISNGAELNLYNENDEFKWIDDENYLYAYCELRNENRYFRIDRIKSIKILK